LGLLAGVTYACYYFEKPTIKIFIDYARQDPKKAIDFLMKLPTSCHNPIFTSFGIITMGAASSIGLLLAIDQIFYKYSGGGLINRSWKALSQKFKKINRFKHL
jgi:hypothetical protein